MGNRITRRTAIGLLAAAVGAIGVGVTGLISLFSCGASRGSSGGGMIMGNLSQADMNIYMDMFNRHTEIRRTVEEIPGGVRTTTESDASDLVAQLQTHVSDMYNHLNQDSEVTCMSQSIPTLFSRAKDYQRHLTLTAKGVQVTETSNDADVTQAIREHAQEVSGFVRDGMPAMMRGMMGG
jgi:hypothetical protein